MGRRRPNIARDLYDIGVLLPWWATLLLAGGAFLLFRSLSVMDVAPVTGTENLGRGTVLQVTKQVSVYIQYVVPALLVLGAITSFIESRRRSRLFDRVSRGEQSDGVDALNWEQFESLVNEWFARKGYSVTETAKGPDGGIDLKVRKGGVTATVQCKHWKARKVGVNIAREQFGVMAAERVDRGFVVTSGEFTADAYAFAEGKPLTLVNGEQLQVCIAQGGKFGSAPQSQDRQEAQPCPRCGSRMVLRTARNGPSAGTEFWGCSTFPKCRGTRQAT